MNAVRAEDSEDPMSTGNAGDQYFDWGTEALGGKVTFVLGVASEPDPERFRLTPEEAEEIGGDLMLAAKEATE